ncbi:MAG: hypothetical protein ISS29_04370 [Candidatus Marinimicrobia bacterium]|nr:hypothetical protein [Candidatus Neomarinimicrobiota bacterium]
MKSSKSTSQNWIPTDKRFVVFLDILGFKDLVMRSTHEDIYKLLTGISEYRKIIDHMPESKKFPELFGNSGLYTVSFSDSIILFSKDSTIDSFKLITSSAGWLFAQTIKKTIPLKGAIAFGNISINKSNQIYFGQPIIDSYLLEEDLSYFGIVAHNSIDNYIKDNPDMGNIYDYYDVLTPFNKYGSIFHLNLDWFRYIDLEKNNIEKEYLLDKINSFKTMTSGNPRRYVDNTKKVIEAIYEKYNDVS